MRKITVALVLLAGLTLIPTSVFAQEANWDGQYHKDDFTLEVGVGFGSHGDGYGLAIFPGAEWTMADWKIGDVVPLAMGAVAKGFVEFIPGSGLGFGAGGFLAFHLGFKGLDAPEFIQNLDVYTAVGAGVIFVSDASTPFGFVLPTTYGGVAWYFKENMAAFLEGVYWYGWQADGYGGGVLGIRLRR